VINVALFYRVASLARRALVDGALFILFFFAILLAWVWRWA